MRVGSPPKRVPSDDAYVELVRSLFTTLAPTTIMSILFFVVASLATGDGHDVILSVLGVLGGIGSLVRVAVTFAFERQANGGPFDPGTAARAERLFARTYLAFATLLGMFAARALHVCGTEVQTVVAVLVVGYAAGAGAGVALRPRISIPAVLLAVVPTALSAAIGGDMAHLMLALVLTALLAGGIRSIDARHRSEAEKIAMRHTFASLARTDHLTGLANRLALGEAFEREVTAHGPNRLALHCLDLDRFKPVNDQFGHPAGDALLAQVADRLRSLCRTGDVAARLGGDEFVLFQTNVGHPGEAELMARRVVRALSSPYDVEGHRITVGVSLGYAIAETCGDELSHLLGCADTALYRVKREGGGAAVYTQLSAEALAVTA